MSPAESALVRIRDLSYAFGTGSSRHTVLEDLQAEVHPGEIVILTGPSGSGKTTLLTLIGALRSIQKGKLRVLGHELAGLSRKHRVEVRREIGFIFQQHNLFESLTALQNVGLALQQRGRRREVEDRARQKLVAVGLEDRIHSKPAKLSGGQRQRVAIARALAANPRLVLADEPTAALDETSGRNVVQLFQRLTAETGAGVILVTHDPRILDIADRILSMVDGRLVSDVAVARTLEICAFLKKSEVFAHLTPGTLTEVAASVETERFEAGETIIAQGDLGDRFYIVRRGLAQVVVRVDGVDELKRQVPPGDYFGEVALLKSQPRNASVVAVEDVEAYSLGKEAFDKAIQTSSSFEDQLLETWFTRR